MRALLLSRMEVWGVSQTVHTAGVHLGRALVSLDGERLESRLLLMRLWLDAPATEVDACDELDQTIDAALRLRPDCIEAIYARGMIRQHRGDRDGAVASYRTVLEQQPHHLAAQFRLWCLGALTGPTVEPVPVREIDMRARQLRLAPIGPCDSVVLRGLLDPGQIGRVGASVIPSMRALYEAANWSSAYCPRFEELPEADRALLRETVYGGLLPRVAPWFSRFHTEGWPLREASKWQIQMHGPSQPFRARIHPDAPVHAKRDDFVTLWFPFDRCGPGLAPCLDVLPNEICAPIVMAAWGHRTINNVSYEHAEEFFRPLLTPVSFEPGDVIAFGRNVIHATHQDDFMEHDRVSCDVRLCSGPAA